MLILKYNPDGVFTSEKAEPNTWAISVLSNGRRQIVTRCSNGHIGSLDDHTISEDGTVSPSVVCQRDGCGFHEFIQLAGWREVSGG